MAFCCATIWCASKIGTVRRGSASSVLLPTSCSRWTSKGRKLWEGPVGRLSVLDDHRRYVVVLPAVKSAGTELVREQLESAFTTCGVPDGMLMDHGSPWWSARGGSMGATKFSLWLMKQGIPLHWSRVRHPQTQGKVERFHGALQRALERRGVPFWDPQLWLDEYRWEHNHVRPREALG